jgi:hypothetical protein
MGAASVARDFLAAKNATPPIRSSAAIPPPMPPPIAAALSSLEDELETGTVFVVVVPSAPTTVPRTTVIVWTRVRVVEPAGTEYTWTVLAPSRSLTVEESRAPAAAAWKAPKRDRFCWNDMFTSTVVKPSVVAACTVKKICVGSTLVVEVPGPVGVRGTGTVLAEVTELADPTATEVTLITNETEAVVPVPVPAGRVAVKVADGLVWARATADWELSDWFTMLGQLAAQATAA